MLRSGVIGMYHDVLEAIGTMATVHTNLLMRHGTPTKKSVTWRKMGAARKKGQIDLTLLE